MAYQRVRVVTHGEIAGEQAGALAGFLYNKIPSLRLLLALVCLYFPLWWLIGAATEFSGGMILSPVLGLAASIASFFLLRKIMTGYQYDPTLAVLVLLFVGLIALAMLDSTPFGSSHRQDLWGVGMLYAVAVAVMFFKFGHLMRRLIAPLFALLYGLLVLALAVPLVAGSTRLLVRPLIPRTLEVPLVKMQFVGNSQMVLVYAMVDENDVRAQCESGRVVQVSNADVLSGKPLPEDKRRASCRVMSPFQPSFVCPEAPQMGRVHASVIQACEDWRRRLKS